MTHIIYTSKTLESLRCPDGIPPQDAAGLLASGWVRHPAERRLFLLRREIKSMRFATVQGFVLPGEMDAYGEGVREALFSA